MNINYVTNTSDYTMVADLQRTVGLTDTNQSTGMDNWLTGAHFLQRIRWYYIDKIYYPRLTILFITTVLELSYFENSFGREVRKNAYQDNFVIFK